MSLLVESRAEAGGGWPRLPSGIAVTRRHLLLVSLTGLVQLGICVPRRSSALNTVATSGGIDWNSFAASLMPSALRTIVSNDSKAEEEYLSEVLELAEHLDEAIEVDAAQPFRSGVTQKRCLDRFPLMITEFRLDPGATIPLHDHRDYNGVLLVVDGQIRIRSFDIVGPDTRPAAGTTFKIRETRNELLGPGQGSSLSRTRDNIHDIRATEHGATLIDFFTFYAPQGRSFYLAAARDLFEATPAVLEATWLE